MENRARAGAAFALGAGLLWATIPVCVRPATDAGVHPLVLVFYRILFSSALFAGACLAARPGAFRIRPRDLPFFAAFGLLTEVANYNLYFVAIKRISPSIAAVLVYVASPVVIFGASIFYREPLTRRKWTALALSLSGMVLVTRCERVLLGLEDPGRLSPLGIAAGVGAGVTYGLFSLFGKKALERYRPDTCLLWALLFGTLGQTALLGAVGLAGPALATWPAHVWVRAAWLAIGPTVAGYLLYTLAIQRIEAGRAILLASIEPVAAGLLAFLLRGEVPTPLQGLGAVGVLAGAVLVARVPTPPRPAGNAGRGDGDG